MAQKRWPWREVPCGIDTTVPWGIASVACDIAVPWDITTVLWGRAIVGSVILVHNKTVIYNKSNVVCSHTGGIMEALDAYTNQMPKYKFSCNLQHL
jgi:hypothetical protein